MSATPAVPPEVPSWMDESFFAEALKRDFPSATVRWARVEPAVAAGENYATIVFRAAVGVAREGESEKEVALIIKCVPTSEFRAQMVRDAEITLRELRMYTHTLPLLGEPCARPYCYYSHLDNVRDALVIEDLRPKGFRTRDRKVGLDLVHCKLALEQLGRLHGSGIALRINNPETFEQEIKAKYPDTLFNESARGMMDPFIRSAMNGVADTVEASFPFRYHILAAKMREMVDIFFNFMQAEFTLPSDPKELDNTVYTLIHGDSWSNNMLFKYEGGDLSTPPLECMLIDYQISRALPPVIDLLYIFYMSTTQDLRRKHMDDLLLTYWNSVRQILRERGITDPGRFFYDSVETVKTEISKYATCGFFMACWILPFLMVKADDVPDIDQFTPEMLEKEEAPFGSLYSSPEFCKRFREVLDDSDDLGVFESNKWKAFLKTPESS